MSHKILVAVAFLPLAAFGSSDDDTWWQYEDHETSRRTFALTGADARKLLVDNISGAIHVTGGGGSQIQMTVEKRIRARSNEAMAEAKRDVKLDISQQGNFVRLYVDGPFRNSNGGMNYRGDDYYGYHVYFEYDLQVPAETELTLKTLNSAIDVKKTSGDFDVHTLNGRIDMEDIAGSGSANTLNGPVNISFSRNPAKSSSFHTLNGKIDVYFQPKLDADLQFQTLNGGVWSDFDVAPLPPAGSTENGRWKFVYRSNNRQQRARVGNGGPELSFHTLNGPIRLHSKAI
jgi:hypothetical protein